MAGCAWTDAEEQTLIFEGKEGRYSYSQIARMLGKTRNAVIGKANRLGLKRSPTNHFFYDPNWKPRSLEQKRAYAREYQKNWRARNPGKDAAKRWRSRHNGRRKSGLTLDLKMIGGKRKPKDWKPLPTALPDYPSALNLPLISVGRNQCRFMPGELLLCCGHETHNDTAYCEHHWDVCHDR